MVNDGVRSPPEGPRHHTTIGDPDPGGTRALRVSTTAESCGWRERGTRYGGIGRRTKIYVPTTVGPRDVCEEITSHVHYITVT